MFSFQLDRDFLAKENVSNKKTSLAVLKSNWSPRMLRVFSVYITKGMFLFTITYNPCV